MTAIDVRALSKLHGTTPVLLDVTFSVPRGTRAAVTGAAGSGKTTLMKLLAGTLAPSGGRIRLFDLDPRYARLDALASVGFVPQGRTACTSMHVADMFRYAGRARRLPPATLDARIATVAREWDLGPHLASRGDALDHATRARMHVALALLHAPGLLLLDDPFTALPPREADDLLHRLRGAHPDLTTVLATAETGWAAACDRVLHLDHGRLVGA